MTTKKRPFQCPVCLDQLSSAEALREHGSRPCNYVDCPRCGKALKPASLVKHEGNELCQHIAQLKRLTDAGFIAVAAVAGEGNLDADDWRLMAKYGVERRIEYGRRASKARHESRPVEQRFWVPRWVWALLRGVDLRSNRRSRLAERFLAIVDHLWRHPAKRGVLETLIALDREWPHTRISNEVAWVRWLREEPVTLLATLEEDPRQATFTAYRKSQGQAGQDRP